MKMYAPFRVLASVAILATLCSCAPDRVLRPREQPIAAPSRYVAAVDPETIEVIGKTIAGALTDDAIRRQLSEALRDSPFPYQALPLVAYLKLAEVHELSIQIEEKLGAKAFTNLMPNADFGRYALAMPSVIDREIWRGGPDVLVVATTEASNNLSNVALHAFDLNQQRATVTAFDEQRQSPTQLFRPRPSILEVTRTSR